MTATMIDDVALVARLDTLHARVAPGGWDNDPRAAAPWLDAITAAWPMLRDAHEEMMLRRDAMNGEPV